MIPYTDGAVLHHLQEETEVLSTEYREDGTLVEVRCKKAVKERYERYL